MWPATFSARLSSWTALRQEVENLAPEIALLAINKWWFRAPWTPYYLHWDDRPKWPDPWELLNDNVYCPLARGLGMLYTIAIVDRADLQDAVLAETDSDNLIIFPNKQYILNGDPSLIVNSTHGKINTKHILSQNQVKQQIK